MQNINQSYSKDIPYLALTTELWGAYCENLGENCPRYLNIVERVTIHGSLKEPGDYAFSYYDRHQIKVYLNVTGQNTDIA